jgi:heme exporter protein A
LARELLVPCMLEAIDLACLRGDRRLFRGLSFRLGRGELLRVEGANGAGKTSLLRLLAGLGLPDGGEVRWQARPIRQQRERYAQDLLYLGHSAGLKDALTAQENLLTLGTIEGSDTSPPRIAAALDAWGLGRQRTLPVRVLSAGQRRRASLARLSLSRAALWILDEPFSALDTQAVTQLGGQLERHLRAGGLAVVTSHQPLPLDDKHVRALQLNA